MFGGADQLQAAQGQLGRLLECRLQVLLLRAEGAVRELRAPPDARRGEQKAGAGASGRAAGTCRSSGDWGHCQ